MSFEMYASRTAHGDWGITAEEILQGKLQGSIENGLRVLAICYDGSGRSRTVADAMRKRNIPALRLIGGLRQLQEGGEFDQTLGLMLQIINQCPVIAVILTPQEMVQQAVLLSQLRIFRYSTSRQAIESLSTMETGDSH